MVWISLSVLLLIAVVIGAVVWASNDPKVGVGVSFSILGVIGMIVFVIMTAAFSIKTVPAGHVGLVYTFSDITGQREAGLQTIFPWQTFKTASVQVQTLCFMTENPAIIGEQGQILEAAKECPENSRKMGGGLDSFSEENQDVFIDVILNIQVDPANIQSLYRDVGENYVDKLIPGRVAQVFKDETVNYVSLEIAPNRTQLRAVVEPDLQGELDEFSIKVTALLIENISFSPEFLAAIERRQIAEQAALEAEAVAKAAVTIAQGEADANEALAASLSTNGNFILQFRAIEALADNVSIILLPEESGLIPILGESLLGGGIQPGPEEPAE